MKPFVFRKLLRSTFFKIIVILGVIIILVLLALPTTVKNEMHRGLVRDHFRQSKTSPLTFCSSLMDLGK